MGKKFPFSDLNEKRKTGLGVSTVHISDDEKSHMTLTHNFFSMGGDKRGQNSFCCPFFQIPNCQIMPMKLAENYGNPTFEQGLEAIQTEYEYGLAYSWMGSN